MNNKRLFVVAGPGPKGDYTGEGAYCLIDTTTGEVLYNHFCSNARFAKGDLYFNRADRIDILKERFGDVEIKHLSDTDIDSDELLKLVNRFKNA